MALVRTNRGSASGTGSSRSLTAFTPANGSFLVAIVGGIHNNAGDCVAGSGVTGGGLTWTRQAGTQVTDLVYSPVKTFITVWTAPVTTGSSTTVASTNSVANPHGSWIACFEYNGQAASPVGALQTGTRQNASGSASITLPSAPATTSEVLGGAGANNWVTADVIQTGTGWTGLVDINDYGTFTEDHAHVESRTGSTSTTVLWNQLHADPEGATDTSGTGVMIAIEIKEASSGTQTITGVKYTDADSFGTAVVGRGAVGITGVKFTDPDTFGTAVLTKTYGITGVKYTDPDSFGAAVVGRGTVNITGVKYDDPDVFGNNTVSAGSQSITGALYTDPDTFGAHTVGRGAVNVSGSRYTDPDTFGTAVLTTTRGIIGVRFVDPDTFGAASVVNVNSITGARYVDPDTFGTAVVTRGAVNIQGALFIDPDIFYGAQVHLEGASSASLLPWYRRRRRSKS